MIDCHTHVLPGIDDGSKNVEQSLEMLEAWREIGTTTIVASSHFYPDQDLERFLKRREHAYTKLMEAAEKGSYTLENGYPNMLLAAEVLLGTDTATLPGLEKLCIEGTNYILIEMPYGHWSEWVFASLYTIIAKRHLVPIIAHIDRYETARRDKEKLERLLAMNVKIQLNAYALTDMNSFKAWEVRRFAKKLIREDKIDILGSDAHSVSRIPKLKKAYKKFNKKEALF